KERERGSAIIEFSVLGTLIFGVLIHAVVLFGVLHRATLATSAAAREYGRAVVIADSEDEAAARGELLRVRVQTDVAVLRIPFVGEVWPSLSVPVEATHVVQLDRYRSGS